MLRSSFGNNTDGRKSINRETSRAVPTEDRGWKEISLRNQLDLFLSNRLTLDSSHINSVRGIVQLVFLHSLFLSLSCSFPPRFDESKIPFPIDRSLSVVPLIESDYNQILLSLLCEADRTSEECRNPCGDDFLGSRLEPTVKAEDDAERFRDGRGREYI